MRTYFIFCSLIFSVNFFGGCSKSEHSQKTSGPPSPSLSSTEESQSEGQLSNQEALAIKRSKQLLTHPDVKTQIQAIRELRQTYSPEACHVLVDHLKNRESRLPASLDQDGSLDLQSDLSYFTVLIEEIKKMNRPEGNKAVSDFVENFRGKYGDEELGKKQLATFEAQIRNIEMDLSRGIYSKEHKPLQGLTN